MGKLKELQIADEKVKIQTGKRFEPERLVYALTGYTAERRKTGWFVAQSYSPYYDEKPRWRGPFETIESAMLSIARQLMSELADRHTRDIERHRIVRGTALYGLKPSTGLSKKQSKVQEASLA